MRLLTEVYRHGMHYMNIFRGVEGFLTDAEGFMLYAYAYAADPSMGEIVEIGSFKGKSTSWMATAMKDAGKTQKVNAVDWHEGSPEFEAGTRYIGMDKPYSGNTLADFQRNLNNFNLGEFVNPIVLKSDEAVKTWDKPIALLFIDGDHSYDQCRRDFLNWTKFIPIGGTVVMHDATTWEGPKAVVEELINGNDKWVGFTMDSALIATRVK